MLNDDDIEILDSDDNASSPLTNKQTKSKDDEKINSAATKNRINPSANGINNGNQFKNSGNLGKISGANNSNISDEAQSLKNIGKEAIKPIVRKGVQAATGGIVGSGPVTGKIIDSAVDKVADNPNVDKIVTDVTKKISKKKRKVIIPIIITVAGWFLMILLLVMVVVSPIAFANEVTNNTGNWFTSIGNFLIGNGFCSDEVDCQNKYSNQYFEKMNEIERNYNQVCNSNWNSELISATIFYEQMVVNDKIDINDDEDIQESTESKNENFSESANSSYNYKNAHKKIEKLSNKLYPDFNNNDLDTSIRCKADYRGYQNYLPGYIKSNFKELQKEEYSEYTTEIIVSEIMAFGNAPYYENTSVCSDSCEYTVKNQSISNLMVHLIDNNGNDIAGQGLIPFEKYILGVVYGEIGPNAPSEAAKVQAITARSFAVTRASVMNGAGGVKLVEEDDKWVLYIRNSTNDQVYCDPDLGCSQRYDGVLLPGMDHQEHSLDAQYLPKPPLSRDAVLRTYVSEVAGVVALNSDSEIIITGYIDVNQNKWIASANDGKNYTEILREEYTDMVDLSSGNCSALCNSASGPYTEWRQYYWPNVMMKGGYSLKEAGCLTVAIAMQVARSGVSTPLGSSFSPDNLVENYRDILYTEVGDFYWNSITRIVPNFKMNSAYNGANMANWTDSSQREFLINGINNGCYYVVEVKSWKTGQHWVAIDSIHDDVIYMMDPASDNKDLNATVARNGYNYRINTAKCYTVQK